MSPNSEDANRHVTPTLPVTQGTRIYLVQIFGSFVVVLLLLLQYRIQLNLLDAEYAARSESLNSIGVPKNALVLFLLPEQTSLDMSSSATSSSTLSSGESAQVTRSRAMLKRITMTT